MNLPQWQAEYVRQSKIADAIADAASKALDAFADYAESKGWLVDAGSLTMTKGRKDAEFKRLKIADELATANHWQAIRDWTYFVNGLLAWANGLQGTDWETFKAWALSQSGELLTGCHCLMTRRS